MSEWTIHIESGSGIPAATENALELFHEALRADRRARGPSAGMRTDRGSVFATYQVEAASADAAFAIARSVFEDALTVAGLRPEFERIELEPYAAAA